MHSVPYAPIDEPSPNALAQAATSPMWPFLALMLCGGWLGWGWFALNAYATGSATRHREAALAVLGALGGGLLLLGFEHLGAGAITLRYARYAHVGLDVWQLGLGYVLYGWQMRTFPLFEHFEGEARSGMWVLVAGFLLRPKVMGLVDGSVFLVGVAS